MCAACSVVGLSLLEVDKNVCCMQCVWSVIVTGWWGCCASCSAVGLSLLQVEKDAVLHAVLLWCFHTRARHRQDLSLSCSSVVWFGVWTHHWSVTVTGWKGCCTTHTDTVLLVCHCYRVKMMLCCMQCCWPVIVTHCMGCCAAGSEGNCLGTTKCIQARSRGGGGGQGGGGSRGSEDPPWAKGSIGYSTTVHFFPPNETPPLRLKVHNFPRIRPPPPLEILVTALASPSSMVSGTCQTVQAHQNMQEYVLPCCSVIFASYKRSLYSWEENSLSTLLHLFGDALISAINRYY